MTEGDERADQEHGIATPGSADTGNEPGWQPQYGPAGPPFGGYQQQVVPPWTGAPSPSRPESDQPESDQPESDQPESDQPESDQQEQKGPPVAERPAGAPQPLPSQPPSSAIHRTVPVRRQVPGPESQEMAAEPSPGPPPPVSPAAGQQLPRARRRARTTGGYRPPPEIVQEQIVPVPQPVPPPPRPETPVSAPVPYEPDQPPVGPYDGQTHDLSSAQLLRRTKRPPQSGWRKAVYAVSGHTINPGESRADLVRRELVARVNQPLQGCYRIALLSLKGGVGKTTMTTTLGGTFASLRGDRVVALDANPDRGTLAQKQPLETSATVRHLIHDAERIRRYSDVRAYTSQGASRLEIIASERDPAVSEAFSEDDYRRAVELLERYYNIVLTDCGTGLMHSAMRGVLDIADCLIVVSSASIDAARSASATLDWLDAHGYRELVARSVAVINSVRPRGGSVDVDRVCAHFESRCRSVCRIPFDSHLEEGAEIDMERLAEPTRHALLELAATVADDFPHVVAYEQR